LIELGKKNQTGTPEYAELNRRFGWEFNGMRLHEYYFGNLVKGGASLNPNSTLFRQIEEDFGSFENWRTDFTATAALRGIGWTILYYEPIGGRLFNSWVTEHDVGHLAGAVPILALDAFEHAYGGLRTSARRVHRSVHESSRLEHCA
jgi:Fe-Mn family superoxide dismutase